MLHACYLTYVGGLKASEVSGLWSATLHPLIITATQKVDPLGRHIYTLQEILSYNRGATEEHSIIVT